MRGRSFELASGGSKLCAFDDFLCISFSCVWESNLERQSGEYQFMLHKQLSFANFSFQDSYLYLSEDLIPVNIGAQFLKSELSEEKT